MAKRPVIKDMINEAESKILCLLHYRFANGQHPFLTIERLDSFISNYNENIIEHALSKLVAGELCEKSKRANHLFDEDIYKISSLGIEVVDIWSDEQYEQISSDILFEEFDQKNKNLTEQTLFVGVPASDRIVTLDDNQAKEAKENIDLAIEKIEEETFFGNQWVPEKNALIKTLEAGKEYLDSKAIDYRIGMMMLVEPLQRFVEKYKEEAINEGVRGIIKGVIVFLISLLKLTG